MSAGKYADRRRFRRYIVAGSIRFVVDLGAGSTELVNLGEGGMLIQAANGLSDGAAGTFHVVPSRYPLPFEVEGEVVGGKEDFVAVRFLQKHATVSALIQWLEQENCPWTGTTTDALASGFHARDASETLATEAEVPELESARGKG